MILLERVLVKTLDITRIHRPTGRTGDRTAFVTTRPCRAPHQTISNAGLVRGRKVPRMGREGRE
jgi:predicted ATPase with chaperone activity